MATDQTLTPDAILTVDGTPLKESLQKSLRRNKLRAMFLVAGPLLFLIFLFIIPIGSMLLRSIDDSLVNRVMPNTLEVFESWDKTSEPPEAFYAAIVKDITAPPERKSVVIQFRVRPITVLENPYIR